MSPAVRVRALAGLAAVAAAAVVVGVVSATGQDPPQPQARSCRQPGHPWEPFLVPGVPTTHAAQIKHAFTLPERRAAWAMEPVEQSAPKDPAVQFNYGVTLFCAGYVADAAQAFAAAKTAGRNTLYEVRADSVLHPQYFTAGYPIFEPAGPNVLPLLRQGIAAQRAGHQHTAERLYARAARLHPDDDEAQVAAAVGRFDEDDLAASFSRLGPLLKRFPQSVSVRYHLGLLLAWTAQRDQAVIEFRDAKRLSPNSKLGREANLFLVRLENARTSRPQR